MPKTLPFYREDVVTIDREATVLDAARLMRERHVGDVVVVENEAKGRAKPLGILTDRDIVTEVLAESVPLEKLVVQDVMSDELVTAKQDATPFELITLMRVRGVRRLPVVDASGCLVGLVSSDDVLDLLGSELQALAKVPRHQRQIEIETRSARR